MSNIKKFFNVSMDTVREVFTGTTHRRRLFALSFSMEVVALLTSSYLFGTLLALAACPVGEFIHVNCPRKYTKIFWWEIDVPDLSGFMERLKDDIVHGQVSKTDESNIRFGVAGVIVGIIFYILIRIVLHFCFN